MRQTKLKTVITERAIVQRKMAIEIGMTPQKLNDIVQDRLKGYRYRPRIAEYIGEPISDLFDDEPKQSLRHSSQVNSRPVRVRRRKRSNRKSIQ